MQIDTDVGEVGVEEASVLPDSPLAVTSSILSEVLDGDGEGSGSVSGGGGGEMAMTLGSTVTRSDS